MTNITKIFVRPRWEYAELGLYIATLLITVTRMANGPLEVTPDVAAGLYNETVLDIKNWLLAMLSVFGIVVWGYRQLAYTPVRWITGPLLLIAALMTYNAIVVYFVQGWGMPYLWISFAFQAFVAGVFYIEHRGHA